MSDNITWKLQSFEELSNAQLYQILRLRSEVFVVEQQCVFQDIDMVDLSCHHLTAYKEDVLVAVSRIVPPGLTYAEPSIGRVAVAAHARGMGLGVELILKSVQSVENHYNCGNITIGAQMYLKKFYNSFGFQQLGAPYLEDGIEHIKMRRKGPDTI